jgi:hypothetical protein
MRWNFSVVSEPGFLSGCLQMTCTGHAWHAMAAAADTTHAFRGNAGGVASAAAPTTSMPGACTLNEQLRNRPPPASIGPNEMLIIKQRDVRSMVGLQGRGGPTTSGRRSNHAVCAANDLPQLISATSFVRFAHGPEAQAHAATLQLSGASLRYSETRCTPPSQGTTQN